MASRVNVKFVLILSAALTAVFIGVVGVALWVLSNNGPRLELEGDQLMAAGEYENAKKVYGKAYIKDQSSIVRLDKYIGAIEAWTPKTPSEYTNAYGGDLLSAYLKHAVILGSDVASHERYLEARFQQARWYSQRGAWEGLASATDDAIGFFEFDPSADQGWHRLVRYRGLARVALMDVHSNSSETASQQERSADQIEQDLNTALEVNPDDTDVVIGLARFFSVQSQRLRQSRRTEDEADQAAARATEVIDEYVASHPLDAKALEYRVRLSFIQNDPGLDETLRGEELIEARTAFLATLEAPYNRLAEILEQQPTDAIDPLHLDRVIAIERQITGESTRSAALIDRVLADRPNDPTMLGLRAILARQTGDQEQALSHYQKIVEMPWPRVSLEGAILLFQQENAAVAMTQVAIALWGTAAEEEKESALRRVTTLRMAAGERVRDTDARLILLDGRIAYAQGNLSLAQEKLSAYNELAGGTDIVALRVLADIYLKNNELGSARETIQNLIEIWPQEARYHMLLAQVESRLSNYDTAREYARRAVELNPEDLDARELLVQLEGFVDPQAIADTDPLQAAIIKSQLLAMGDSLTAPDISGAIAVLDAALESLDETSEGFGSAQERMAIQKIELLAISGDRATALEQVRRWMKTYPDSESLAALDLRLTVPDTLEGDFQVIDAGTDPEHIRLVQKYLVSVRRGEDEQAARFIAEALERAPKDPVVVEVAFVAALKRSDFGTARDLASTATEENIDRLRGDVYAARLVAAQGDIAAAITTLGQATRSATAPAGAWRLLGQYQSQLGRYSEAVASLSESLKRSPNDVHAVLSYVQTLVLAGRNSEALREARRYEPLARSSGPFNSLWLNLEAQYGDKEIALARREEIHSRVPDLVENTIALVRLYIDLDRLEEARARLDIMRNENANLTVVVLEAFLHKKEGNIAAAREVFDDHIASAETSDGGVTYADYASYASFLVNAALIDDAITLLEKAQAVQKPGSRKAEAELGRLLFNLSRFEESIGPLERALETEGLSVRVLLAEAHIRIEDFDEAKRVLGGSTEDWEDNLDLSLVMIECTNAAGDRSDALRIADEVVRRFSGSPRPYVQRAALKALDASGLEDALDDLSAAIRRDPTNWLALVMRSEINSRLGNGDDALRDLRKAVRANPNLDSQRRVLMLDFLRSGGVKDASAIADEAIAARPDDLNLVVSMGDLFASAAQWDQATVYFAAAWDRAPSQVTGMRYIVSLIRSTRMSLNDAERVLADPICDTENSAGMLVLRASLRMKEEQPSIARRDASRAVQLPIADLATTARVLEDLNTVFTSVEETARFVLLQDLTGLPGRGGDYFRAVAMMEIPSRAEEGLELLRAVASDESDPIVNGNAQPKLISVLLSSDRGEYAEALELMLAWFEKNPDQWAFANNIAFVLSKHMDRPDEALAYAERAREIDPNNPVVLDTLGYVYRRIGRYEDAERSLRLAMKNTLDRSIWVISLIHLGQTFADQGKKSEAQTALEAVESALADLDQDVTNNKDFLDLKRQIEGLQ